MATTNLCKDGSCPKYTAAHPISALKSAVPKVTTGGEGIASRMTQTKEGSVASIVRGHRQYVGVPRLRIEEVWCGGSINYPEVPLKCGRVQGRSGASCVSNVDWKSFAIQWLAAPAGFLVFNVSMRTRKNKLGAIPSFAGNDSLGVKVGLGALEVVSEGS